MFIKPGVLRGAAMAASLMMPVGLLSAADCTAQATAGAGSPASARQMGTIKIVAGNQLTLTTDTGQQVSVEVANGARILQLSPGNTNLKDAQAISISDIAVGDRVLVAGKAGADTNTLEATRVILMKSSDIAQKHAMEQSNWQKRGNGGIVIAVNEGTGALTVSERAKKITVNTSGKTEFRRYAGDSVKFEDARPGTLAQVQPGDQLRVLGAESADGLSIDAEEVVSGSFKNLAGTIASIDAANQTLTLKDLATKKVVTVKVTANSSVRALPSKAAAMFAARAKDGAAAGRPHTASEHAGQGTGGPVQDSGEAGAEGRSAGVSLSQLVSRLPNETLADLKVGDAVMIVASQPEPGSSSDTAVTLLSGVEPILAATPSGAEAMTLSPWNIGGGAGDGGAQ